MARNPFALAEKAGRIVGYSIVGAFIAFAVFAVGFAAVREWGWGALWAIPAIPVGFVALVVVAGLIRVLCDTVHDRWLMAKWRWDDRHQERRS